MENQLFIFPDRSIKNLYEKNQNIIFLDYNGWWLYDKVNNKRIFQSFYLNTVDTKDLDLSKIRYLINWWSPIWTRWVSNSVEYENYRIENILLILKISSGLIQYKINKIFFFTSVPHHIDSISVSICASILNIEEVFLYNIVLDSSLLPLRQINGIKHRQILGKKVSDNQYEDVIDSFLSNKINENPPTQNTKITKLKKSYFFALLYLLRFGIHNFVASKIKKNTTNDFLFYRNSTFLDNYHLLNNQKSYLKYYTKNKLNILDTNTFLKSKIPQVIVAAHFQPEATSFPEGDCYSTHIEIILKLRMLGFEGKIGYKEHPATWLYTDKIVGFTKVGIYRSVAYANNLLNLGCVFLDENTPLSISENDISYVPVTISGSLAIERSLAGLYTIIVGEPWFKGLPGTIHINEIESLKTIENRFILRNSEIAAQAKLFLINSLNNNTIKNIIGIGTGVRINDKNELLKFEQTFSRLIN